MDKRSLGYTLALASAAAGAVRYNLAVFAKPEVSPTPFLAYSLVVGVLLSGVHVLAKDGVGGIVPLKGRWKHALLYAVLLAWSTLSHFLALNYLNETVMTSMSQLGILFTISLAVWLLGERFTRTEWLATVVICAGVLGFQPWEPGRSHGLMILMSGILAGACATIVAKRGVRGIPPRVMMLWRNVVALLVVSVWVTLFARWPTSMGGPILLAIVGAGVFGPYLHGLFFLESLLHIDAAKAALMNRIQPAIVFVLSWAFLGRTLGYGDLASAALMVVGTLWLALARTAKKRG